MTECDVVIIGAGAAGLATAVTAAHAGLDVVVAERDEYLGGSAAWSGGWLYVPGDPGARANVSDSRDEQLTYLRSQAGDHLDMPRLEAFLDAVPKAITFFEQQTPVEFVHPPLAPDYDMRAPGSKEGGRSVYSQPMDARELGASRLRLQPYLSEVTFFGVMPQIGHDLEHFLKANKSLKSLLYVCRRLVQVAYETVRYGRGVRLSNGNALMARLLKAADESGVHMLTQATATKLEVVDGRVVGAVLQTPRGPVTYAARRGVVLACGGISHDAERHRQLFPHAPDGTGHHSPMSAGHDGAAARLVAPLDGAFDDSVMQPAAWAPVSVFRGRRGRRRVYPHLRGVGLPGVIAVAPDGRRFANESNSYHAFVQALIASCPEPRHARAFLVCDARAMHRYGLGFAKPWPNPRFTHERSGYLLQGATLRDLAQAAGIDPDGLQATVSRFNTFARRGEDPDFGRGEDLYNRFKGDTSHGPNPALGPLERGPFFATQLRIGDIGSFAGLRTDARAHVLTTAGEPIAGLYAVGTAASSVFGGAYPGHGANLGPALTFGFVVGQQLGHAETARPTATSRSEQ